MAALSNTPGPWRAERAANGDYRVVYNETGNWLAEVFSDGECEAAKADAALIAAAPELLTALKDIRAELSSNPAKDPTLRMDIAYRIAAAAISKATAGGAV